MKSEPREDIYISWGYVMTPPVENLVLRRKPQSTFCVSVRLWPHSGMHIWIPSFWTQRILGNWVWGPSGTLLKEQGSYSLVQNMGAQRTCLNTLRTGDADLVFNTVKLGISASSH